MMQRAEKNRMVDQEIPDFIPGDIIFCPGKQVLPHILTRWVTQSRGEPPTYAVHVAQFLGAHWIIEMQAITKKRSTEEFFRTRQAFEVWRYSTPTLVQRQLISQKTLEYRDRKFGWPKLFTHLLDGLVNKVVRKQIYFFRRLNHDQRYPICSWITAFSYDRVLNYRFGVSPECADPDQIYDWVRAHPDEWTLVFSLQEDPQSLSTRPSGRSTPRESWGSRIRDLAIRGGRLRGMRGN